MSQIEGMRDIPIVLISSMTPAEGEQKRKAVGASAFLPKPLDSQKLNAVIQELTAKKPDGELVSMLKLMMPPLLAA
jgi:CheY-like chemotaxis protein